MTKQKKIQKFLDITTSPSQQREADFNRIASPGSFRTTLFSRGRKTDSFFTEDSKLYITPREFVQLRAGVKLDRQTKKWDCLSSRITSNFVRYQPSQTSLLLNVLGQRYAIINESLSESADNLSGHFSVVRLWNLSIVASVLFGMVAMTFVYRYLGQGAAADQLLASNAPTQQVSASNSVQGKVMTADTSSDSEAFTQQVLEIEQANDQKALQKEMTAMVKGYPIEKMVPYIAQQDKTVAAFIIGIAKQESGWGEHVPVLNGQDCYNYWGYRGQRMLMGTGGHTCFNSPQDAVDTVAKRIKTLVEENGNNTPAKMVNTWKCGTSCAGDAGAKNWISEVSTIVDKFNTD